MSPSVDPALPARDRRDRSRSPGRGGGALAEVTLVNNN